MGHRNTLDLLISAEEIEERVTELAQELERNHPGGDMVIVSVLGGSVIFLADLVRKINLPVRIDTVSVSSYAGKAVAPGELKALKTFSEDVRGKHVVLIDDILDTGGTLAAVTAEIQAMKPASLKTCVFLSKQKERNIYIKPDCVGFEVKDLFVVGYGLDYDGMYRNLPYVAVLNVT